MYSLALIIFVVSEKKAETKLPRNDHWKVLYKVDVFYVDRKSKMAATAIHRLTLDPMGKCSNAFFSETTNIIKACNSFREEDISVFSRYGPVLIL
jgi:hypothetical protein